MITFNQIKEDAVMIEVDLSWAVQRRKHFLDCEISLYREATKTLMASMAGRDYFNRELIFHWVKGYVEDINQRKKERSYLEPIKNNSREGITDAMIQKAKGSPVENILPNPVKNNLTNCIFHEDKHPSMSIKNNQVKCFACGNGGDSIAVYMALYNVNFRQAVKSLN